MNEKLKHWLKISTVVLGWSITPIAGDYLIDRNHQLSAYQLAFFRYFLAAVAIYIILQFQTDFKNKDIIISFKNKWKAYILVSITSACMPVFLFLAVRNTSGSSASFLLNANILLIPIIAFFLIKEKITKPYVIGLLVSFIGLFFVIFDKSILDFSNLPVGEIGGNLLALGSGFFWALYTVLLKKYFSDENPLLVIFLNLMIGSFVLVFLAFLVPPTEMTLDWLGIILVIAIAVISTALAYTFWLDLLSYLTTTQTGILQAMVPILSVVWAVAFLKDSISYFFGIGAVLIIVSIIFVETMRSRAKTQNRH